MLRGSPTTMGRCPTMVKPLGLGEATEPLGLSPCPLAAEYSDAVPGGFAWEGSTGGTSGANAAVGLAAWTCCGVEASGLGNETRSTCTSSSSSKSPSAPSISGAPRGSPQAGGGRASGVALAVRPVGATPSQRPRWSCESAPPRERSTSSGPVSEASESSRTAWSGRNWSGSGKIPLPISVKW